MRSPREDYLTECFANVFNRLPPSAQRYLVSELLIPESLKQAFDQILETAAPLKMETQHYIEGGRIDLVLYAGGHPLVAIENKINAPVLDQQLVRYGQWIRSEAAGPIAVVCFLTHLTQPPSGFLSGRASSGHAVPHITTWAGVADLLMRLLRNKELDAAAMLLCNELRYFLEENDMSTEYAGRDEFAAALLYLRAGSLMDRTFSDIYSHIKSLDGHFRRNESSREYSLQFRTELKLIWGWAYLTHPNFNELFFGYGIALEPQTVFKGGTIPSSDSVFICLGADDRRGTSALRAARDIPEKPWTWADITDWFALVCFKPLHEFLRNPTEFAPKMISWIDDEQADVDKFVTNLK